MESSVRVPGRLRADMFAILILLAGIAIVIAHRWHYDNWLTEYDIMTFFLPWFGVTGDQLRESTIPGWTPFFLSGSSVVGDPSAGWMYLPVMLSFSLFSILTAFKTMILIQLLIGGLATYAFARRLGLVPLAALMSASAFVFGPYMAGQTLFTTVAGQVGTWIPVALLATECSMHTNRWISRAAWWSLAGIALSQMAASWPGQGMYTGFLIVAAWVGYRALLSPLLPVRPIRQRVVDLVTTGLGTFAIGIGLGAAGILPRLALNAQSSIANGDYSGVMGGDYQPAANLNQLFRQMILDDQVYRPMALGGVVLILALLAPLLNRRSYGVPFFAGVWLVGSILALHDTPLHRLFYLIPQFERIHEHSPQRILWLLFIAPSMLAGITVQAMLKAERPAALAPLVIAPLIVVGEMLLYLFTHEAKISWLPVVSPIVASIVVAGTLYLAHFASGHRETILRAGTSLLILLAFLVPAGWDIGGSIFRDNRVGTYLSTDAETSELLATYVSRTDPSGAGEFLQERVKAGETFRYVGFAGRNPGPNQSSYSSRRLEPEVMAILVNGRSARLGLEQIQGYNPTHLRWYDEYLAAMNGGPQDYHWADPYPSALGPNPLMDMLNVQYIVVAHNDIQVREVLPNIAEGRTEVFRNDLVTIYENPAVFPRSWIVHDVRSNNDGEGLAQLADGRANGHEVAFVEGPLPDFPTSSALPNDGVVITEQSSKSLKAVATSEAPGLVVFSEVYENGWKVTVDGENAELLRTDHALRGVVIPEGEHIIEMRYEPRSLTIGLIITGITSITVLIVVGIAIAQWWRFRRESGPNERSATVVGSNP